MRKEKLKTCEELFGALGQHFRFPPVPTGRAESIAAFFSNCMEVAKIQPKKDAIIKWHNLLSKFVDRAGNRLLLRMYEGVTVEGRLETRRGAVTRMNDGFEFVFASNYFARVIYTMAYIGFTPSLSDFEKMINNMLVCISYPLHVNPGEQEISAYKSRVRDAHYNTIGFYTPGWYLAHIVGVRSVPFRGYGNRNLKDFVSAGKSADWQLNGGMVVRSMGEHFNVDDLKLVKAHCLRFLDPINYFLVPCKAQERHKYGRSLIGEDEYIVRYAMVKMRKLLGDKVYKDFCKRALVPFELMRDGVIDPADRKINIEFSAKPFKKTIEVKRDSLGADRWIAGIKKVAKPKRTLQPSEAVLLNVLRAYLVGGKSFRSIENEVLGLGFKVRGGGFIAKGMLNALGVDKNAKGVLSTARAEEYISKCGKRLQALLKKLF